MKIKLFATLRDKAGQRFIDIELTETITAGALKLMVAEQHPQLRDSIDIAVVAVNKMFATPETLVAPNDEVALFPPVSGGNDLPHPTFFLLAAENINIDQIHAAIRRPDIGSIVSFSGSVRGETDREGLPPETLELEYEAYEEMAVERMAQIAREIWEKWPLIKGVAIVQRIGRLQVGDTTTFVACASGHRDQGGFEAALYGIDRLKEIVPVWKKEIGADESVWVEGAYTPTEADN